ncbi:MAG TPA: thioredoxin domain-containing protein [Pyrinomonadaceae bacterium]|nr:thioredoxin domain-containing protein [Pyrinomonadaceae bacterium]
MVIVALPRRWRTVFASFRLLLVMASVMTILTVDLSASGQSPDRTVAVVAGTKISEKELEEAVISQVYGLQQQIYSIRKAALENLVLRTLLEGEATKRHISVEELRKQMTVGNIEVPQAEIERLYLENASVMGAMSPDEAKLRLRLDLESQARMKNYRAALQLLRSTTEIEWNLVEPTLLVSNNPDAPSLGPVRASVSIITFADFQCPYCREFHNVLKQIVKAYPSEVRLEFRNLPLGMHPEALSTARAAFCAGQQDGFWKYHDALFAADDVRPEQLKKMAANLGLDLPKFQTCIASELAEAAVRRDVQEARKLGIDSTPTFIINGEVIRGAVGFEEFKAIVERKLKLAQKLQNTTSEKLSQPTKEN